jgi:hypothetical protein
MVVGGFLRNGFRKDACKAEETMVQKPDSLCSGGLDREFGGYCDAP